jgi:predicted HTH transcriptional regulator
MKVDITIEFDKELAAALKYTVREFSEGIKNLQGSFDKAVKSDLSVSTERVPEPKPKTKPKQTKPAAKRKPRAKQTLSGTVLKIIEKNKDGISRKELQEETGFSSRQITDYVYQLKKLQKIEKTEDGLFKSL